MRDLTKNDIITKGPILYTRYVQYINGVWTETTPGNPLFTVDGVTYYKIPSLFGILTAVNDQLSKPDIRGEVGDYLTRQVNGSYAVLKKSQFDLLFPAPKAIITTQKPLNSKSL